MLSEVFGFHPLAIDDSRTFGQRPKLDSYDDFTFLVVYGASPDEDGLVEAHVFYTDRFLVIGAPRRRAGVPATAGGRRAATQRRSSAAPCCSTGSSTR